MLLATARLKIRSFARQAGDDTYYTDALVDDALQLVGARFCRITRAVRTTTDLAITAASADLPALPAGFRPEQALAGWLDDDCQSDVRAVDYATLRRDRRGQGGGDYQAAPRKLAFTSSTAGQVWPTPDQDYTLTLAWWQTFQNGALWVPGITGAWGNAAAYALGDVASVRVSNTVTLYRCIAVPSLNNAPATSPAYWAVVSVTAGGDSAAGDAAAAAADPGQVTLNLPDDWLAEILPYGPPAVLQHTEPEQAYASTAWKTYLDFERSLKGVGSDGAKTIHRRPAR